ncbi:unnamed protein product [Closterium sp. NIES-64]|nr:unnamed protein product [Closterium sp. NIES-64]
MTRFRVLLAIVLLLAVASHAFAQNGNGQGSTSNNTTGTQGSNNPTGDPCVPAQNITCSTACNSGNAGVYSRYSLPAFLQNATCPPEYNNAISTSRLYCYDGMSLPACCNKCISRRTCTYWQFYQPRADCANCGVCYIYPPLAAPPTCIPEGILWNVTRVARPCPSSLNDPHFTGAEGTQFDFNGLPDQSFCLVTDARIHVNMRMRGYYDDRTVGASILKGGKAVRTWIKELGILWIDAAGVKHSFRIAARDGKEMARGAGFMGAMEFDGKALPLLSVGSKYALPGGLTLAFTGYEKQGGGFFDVDAYSLEVDGLIKLDVKLRPAHPLLQTEADAQTHINLHFASVERTPAMHGIMGQTYREGRRKRALEYTSLSVLLRRSFAADGVEGRGYLDGEVKDYRTSSVMSADCLYTAFDGHTLPPINEANGVLLA